MNKQTTKRNFHRFKQGYYNHKIPVVLRMVVMTVIAAVVSAGVSQQVNVHATQTSANYCGQYSVAIQNNACSDGIKGKSCSDYAIVADQATADICTKASQAQKSGQISDTQNAPTSPSPTTNASTQPSPSPSNNQFALMDQLGQSSNLTQYIGVLDGLVAASGGANGVGALTNLAGGGAGGGASGLGGGAGGGASGLGGGAGGGASGGAAGGGADDSKKESYVNGAGKQQPIITYPSGVSNGPAIVWFDGGGWHADDGTAYCLATGSPQKNCVPGANGGPDTSNANENDGPPTGGGANARGYTVLNVTYRLGSDGVYYMLDDVMRGLRHVIQNAKLYDIDPAKIIVGGDSAGGSLSMRVAASGKSGAKAAVGWSAPTNGYTALFKSFQAFLIGMDHSTCIPTDLAGGANTASLLMGGSGNVAQEGQGLASNDFSSLGSIVPGGTGGIGGGDPMGMLTQVLTAGQDAATIGISGAIFASTLSSASGGNGLGGGGTNTIGGSGGGGGLGSLAASSGLFNLTASKLNECVDNLKTLSPAVYASPDTPPSFLGDFDDDDLIDVSQSYGMRDKLLGMGIQSEAFILPGNPSATHGLIDVTTNHLGYDSRFVCPTINFLDKIVQPGKGVLDCGTGKSVNGTQPSTGSSSSSGGGGSSSSSGGGGSSSGGGGSSSSTPPTCLSPQATVSSTCTGSGTGGTVKGQVYNSTNGPTGDNAWQSNLSPTPQATQTQSWSNFYDNLPQSGTTAPYISAPTAPSGSISGWDMGGKP